MPHTKQPGSFSTSHLTYGSPEKVDLLLEAGVIDAQALNFGSINRLASKLGMSEVERARAESERIAEETGYKPPIFGRELVEVVRMDRAAKKRTAPEDLAEKVNQKRAGVYERMARSAIRATSKEVAA